MPATVAATAAMESTATAVKTTASMESSTATVKPAAVMKSIAAMEAATAVEATVTSESFVVKSAAAKAITTATVEAPAIETTAVETAAVESMEPRASPDEDSVEEPIRAVVAVRRASVWVIIIVSIRANRGRANISVPWANSNADKNSLCVRERRRTQSNAKQSKNS